MYEYGLYAYKFKATRIKKRPPHHKKGQYIYYKLELDISNILQFMNNVSVE